MVKKKKKKTRFSSNHLQFYINIIQLYKNICGYIAQNNFFYKNKNIERKRGDDFKKNQQGPWSHPV